MRAGFSESLSEESRVVVVSVCVSGAGARSKDAVCSVGGGGVWGATACPRAAALVCWPIWETAPSEHPPTPVSPRFAPHKPLFIVAERGPACFSTDIQSALGVLFIRRVPEKTILSPPLIRQQTRARNIMEIELKLFILRGRVYVCALFLVVVLRMRT